MSRTYTAIANASAKDQLARLLTALDNPALYRESMIRLGELLAKEIVPLMKSYNSTEALVVSTAEDADFLQLGVTSTLQRNHINNKLAIFWNHHYQTSSKRSVAPIIHRFVEPNYEHIRDIVIVKSIMSGSCVVRTNLIEILDKIENINNIFILAPVAHKQSEEKLKKEFPSELSEKFRFFCFALDSEKTSSGEVKPGIGGQIHNLLGLNNQPALTGYIPDIVKRKSFESTSNNNML